MSTKEMRLPLVSQITAGTLDSDYLGTGEVPWSGASLSSPSLCPPPLPSFPFLFSFLVCAVEAEADVNKTLEASRES